MYVPIDPFSEHLEADLNEEEVEQLERTFSQPLTYTQEEVLIALYKSYIILAAVFTLNNISILSWDLYPRQCACPGETLLLSAALEFHSKISMYGYHCVCVCVVRCKM